MLLAVMYGLYVANSPHFTPQTSMQWSKIPPDAQERIAAHAGGGQIREISTGVRRNKVYYRATATMPDGQDVIIKVDETGKLIGLRYSDEEGADCKSEQFQVSPTR